MPTYDFFDHDRFVMVRTELGIGPAQLFGHIALLEKWLSKFHLDGDVTGVDATRIEIAAGWIAPEVPKERAGAFVQAMRNAELIHEVDGRTVVRGWVKHAPEFVKKRLLRLQTKNPADNGGQRRTTAATGGQRLPERSGDERSGEEKRNTPLPPKGGEKKEHPDDGEVEPGTGVGFPMARRVLAAYPRKALREHRGLRSIARALAEIRSRGHPDPARWLLDRVELFAKSDEGRNTKHCQACHNWMDERRYDDDPAEWSPRERTAADARMSERERRTGDEKLTFGTVIDLSREAEGVCGGLAEDSSRETVPPADDGGEDSRPPF